MTDNVLTVLKFAFLALLYLFFLRVLWVVASEVRAQRAGVQPGNAPGAPAAMGAGAPNPFADASPYAAAPAAAPPATYQPPPFSGAGKPKKGKRGVVARFVIIEPRERRGQAFPISQEFTIGRSSGCSIQILNDTFISSLHCRVYRDEAGNTLLEDLGSTNGTYLNGDRIRVPKPIHRGDRVQIGGTIVEAQ
jgi:pSer/pThr/pTyr-binding forkhead associated (FHA) protein